MLSVEALLKDEADINLITVLVSPPFYAARV